MEPPGHGGRPSSSVGRSGAGKGIMEPPGHGAHPSPVSHPWHQGAKSWSLGLMGPISHGPTIPAGSLGAGNGIMETPGHGGQRSWSHHPHWISEQGKRLWSQPSPYVHPHLCLTHFRTILGPPSPGGHPSPVSPLRDKGAKSWSHQACGAHQS